LREKANKREAKKENCTKRGSFYRIIEPIYIKPLASRPPFVFLECSESFGEGKDMESETFETLKCATIMGKGFDVTTLALGSRPRQGVARLRAKREAQESCRMLP
jgi:hypothetical protein